MKQINAKMFKFLITLDATAALLLVCTACKKKPEPFLSCNVHGKVTDPTSKQPIEDFRIMKNRVSGTRVKKTIFITDANGNYSGIVDSVHSCTELGFQGLGDCDPQGPNAPDCVYYYFNNSGNQIKKYGESVEVNFECTCTADLSCVLINKNLSFTDSVVCRLDNGYLTERKNAGPSVGYTHFVTQLLSGTLNRLSYEIYTAGQKITFRDSILPFCRETVRDTLYYN